MLNLCSSMNSGYGVINTAALEVSSCSFCLSPTPTLNNKGGEFWSIKTNGSILIIKKIFYINYSVHLLAIFKIFEDWVFNHKAEFILFFKVFN